MEGRRAYLGTDKGVVMYASLPDDHSPIVLHPIKQDLPPIHLMVLSKKGEYLMVAADSVVAIFANINLHGHKWTNEL